MENITVVRQPMLDATGQVVGYEILLDETGNSNLTQAQKDQKAAETVHNFFLELEQSNFSDAKDFYLTFPPSLLEERIPSIFPKDKLVIQFNESVIMNPMAKNILKEYKKEGYRCALVDFIFTPRHLEIVAFCDIVKINFKDLGYAQTIKNTAEMGMQMGLKVCAYNVDTPEAAKLCDETGVMTRQGRNIGGIITSRITKVEHLKSNFFRLMFAVLKEEPEIDEIAEIISQDVSLSFRLLKMINSAYFGLKNKVTSINQALTIWGLKQLRQWVYLLSFDSEKDPLSMEIIRISFVRSHMCQEISQIVQGLEISPSEAYMIGMFSTLPELTGTSLDEVLGELPISDAAKGALCHKPDLKATHLLDLIISYEHAEWSDVKKECENLGIDRDALTSLYLSSAKQIDETWAKITSQNSNL